MAKRRRNPFRRKFSKTMQRKLVMLFAAIVLAFVFLVGRITYINAAAARFRLSGGTLWTGMVPRSLPVNESTM